MLIVSKAFNLAGSGDYIRVRFPYQLLTQSRVKSSNYLTQTMWYVVQQQPGETIALSNHSDYDSAKFKLMNTQRFDSKNFYEILHSSDIVELNS